MTTRDSGTEAVATLRAKAVLFDIDNTVVATGPGWRDDVFEEVLREQAVAVGIENDSDYGPASRPSEEAASDIAARLQRLGIDPEVYMAALCDAMKPWVKAYDDAVRTIPVLHERGYRLYPATTNGRLACLAKFRLAGLAQGRASPYFPTLFGGDQVHASGKTTPRFYEALLRRIQLDADDVVMVGDDPHHDLALASAAGIRQFVLPRRDQADPVVREADGGIYVRSLESLLDMLPKRA